MRRVCDGSIMSSTSRRPAATKGLAKGVAIKFDQFLALGRLVFGGIDFAPEDDLGRALGAHDGDFGRGPGQHAIGAQVFAAHCQIGAAVSLAHDHGDLRHGRRRIGEQHLGAVADNPAVLLLHAGQKSRHIDNVTSGILKALQKRMKRAALSEALMSSAPANTEGWFATIPTGRPWMRPNPITMFGANPGWTSRKSW